MAVPNVLYHYCRLETFLSIVNSGVLRLSDSRCTNDAYENIWITKFIRETLAKIEQSNEQYTKELEKYITVFGNEFFPYIACFSENDDSLSQWRAYGDDGNGVAIGFEIKIPQGLPMTHAGKNALDYSLRVNKVVYDCGVQRKLVEDEIQKILEDGSEHLFLHANNLIVLSYIYKHPAFQEEKEWRIINTPLIDTNYLMSGQVSDMKFRVTRDRLIPFWEMPITVESNYVSIKEVILGPKNKTIPKTMHDFLEMRNFHDVIIKQSNAPYR